jgi:[acyl-carrier-protein] S-malonyltransferase
MREALAGVHVEDPQVPIASNASGSLVRTADDIREALTAQIASPVRWLACVQALVAEGVQTFLELGPGRVLSGLVRQTEPGADVFSADSVDRLDEFAAAHPMFVR